MIATKEPVNHHHPKKILILRFTLPNMAKNSRMYANFSSRILIINVPFIDLGKCERVNHLLATHKRWKKKRLKKVKGKMLISIHAIWWKNFNFKVNTHGMWVLLLTDTYSNQTMPRVYWKKKQKLPKWRKFTNNFGFFLFFFSGFLLNF